MNNNANSILNYNQIFIPVFLKEEAIINIAIRSFSRIDSEGVTVKSFLVVDPYNLQTAIKNISELDFRKPSKSGSSQPGYFSWGEIKNTPYLKLLFKFTSEEHYKLENSGLTCTEIKNPKGVCLTIDMCPSCNQFEKEFFEKLIVNNPNKPVPIAIAMSGLWLISYPEEFVWLIQQQEQKNLDITWVNHSYNHLYLHGLPYQENFLLFSLSNINYEILEIEKLLLENNQKPSIFFRFPGLVSDPSLILELRKYGLIPLGSNNWIAKNQKNTPEDGDIILLHGNGNETSGIEIIMPHLENKNSKWVSLYNILTPSSI